MSIRDYADYAPELGAGVYVDPAATVIGRVRLGADVSVWPGTVLRGDVETIDIGAGTNIQDNTVVHVTHDGRYSPGGHPVRVGARVTVGHGVILHGCEVGDLALIGMGSVLLDGAVVESRAMIGAGSLVTPGTRVRSGTLWLGRPAREVRELGREELEQLAYSADHYIQLKNHYQA